MDTRHAECAPIFEYKGGRRQKKPLVVVIGKRDYVIEDILHDVAIVVHYPVSSLSKLRKHVLLEASGILLTQKNYFTVEDLVKFKKLRIIVRIGYTLDNMDVNAAGEYGVAVSNIPGFGVEDAADTAIFLILNIYRNQWQDMTEESGPKISTLEIRLTKIGGFHVRSIRGETLGIIGLGRTGLAVALRAQAFGMNVIFCDPFAPNGIEKSLGFKRVSTIEELLPQADVVTLHCPLTLENLKLINVSRIMLMKYGSSLINTSNSALVDKDSIGPYINVRNIQCFSLDVHQSDDLTFCKNGISMCPSSMAKYLDVRSMELRTIAAVEMRRGIIGAIPASLSNCINEEFFNFKLRKLGMGTGATGCTNGSGDTSSNHAHHSSYPGVKTSPNPPSPSGFEDGQGVVTGVRPFREQYWPVELNVACNGRDDPFGFTPYSARPGPSSQRGPTTNGEASSPPGFPATPMEMRFPSSGRGAAKCQQKRN